MLLPLLTLASLKFKEARVSSRSNFESLRTSQMPHHLISDAHEWTNKIPNVPIYCLAKTLRYENKIIHLCRFHLPLKACRQSLLLSHWQTNKHAFNLPRTNVILHLYLIMGVEKITTILCIPTSVALWEIILTATPHFRVGGIEQVLDIVDTSISRKYKIVT